MGDRLKLQDCKCPICMCILIEPVRMPCNHELCMPCFKQNVEEAHFTCPICRLRISSWARKQSRLGRLVDEERWQQIQEAFPLLCQKRLNGDSDDEDSEYEEESPVKRRVLVAQPGEIRKEYEEEISKFQKLREQEQKKAIEESEQLIKRLQREEILRYEEKRKALEAQNQTDEELAKLLAADLEEEEKLERVKREQTARDEEIARRLQEKEESPNTIVSLSGPSTSSQKGQTSSIKCIRLEHLFNKMENRALHRSQVNEGQTSPSHAFGAFSPTATARLPSMAGISVSVQRAKSTESEDSITTEICHFKPIKTSPRTARRRLADGTRDSPPIVLSTPRNLSNMNNCKKETMAPAMKSRLVEMLSQKLPHSPTKSNSELTQHSKEVQVSPTKHSQTKERETHGEISCVAKGNKDTESMSESNTNERDQRMADIQSKLSKYSRRRKEKCNKQSQVVDKHSEREQKSSDGVNTKRKKTITRENPESKSESISLKRTPPTCKIETPNPRKKCKVDDHHKDQNCNNISMNSKNATVVVVEEEREAPQCHNGRGDENGLATNKANGIQNSQRKGTERRSDGSRKSGGQNTIVRYMELLNAEQTKLQQEELDRRMALDLQRQFQEESSVVRTKGSEDAYPLRTNRKRTYREISPSPEA